MTTYIIWESCIGMRPETTARAARALKALHKSPRREATEAEMFKRLLGTALVFGMAALAPPVAAQPVCGARPAITNWLTENFNETRAAVGLIRSDRVLEVWAAKDSHTWTILVTRPDGISCVVSRGTNWTVFHSEIELTNK